jgi:L-cystine uptake protein TcyP (sodium:dicarboxylate symporter family)
MTVLLAILLTAAVGVLLTLGFGLMTSRFNQEDRRQRQILEAQVEAQQKLTMLTHASLQAVRSQLRGQ